MSFFSAIGDFLSNPNIKGSNTDESSNPPQTDDNSPGFLSKLGDFLKGNNDQSLTHRFFNEANKSIAFLPDAIANSLSGGGYLWKKDPLENAMRSIGAITDMPEAKTIPEKLVGGTGSAVGSIVGPGGLAAAGEKAGAAGLAAARSLLGTDSALTSISQLANPTFASTLGAITTPVFAKPAIDDYTQNPTTRNLLGLGSSLLGGASFGGLTNYLMNSPKSLPLVTEAQKQIPGTNKAIDLESKQLSLIGKYPKAADTVNEISGAQQQAIENNLQSGASGMTGQDVKDAIVDTVQNLKDKKSQEYETGLKALQENAPAVSQASDEVVPTLNGSNTDANGLVQPQRADGLNLSNTSAAIDDLLSQKSEGGKVEQTLQPIISQINQNANSSLPKLASTYSDISNPTHPVSGLRLGNTEQMAATRVAQAYARDIDNAYPGYEALNTQYNRNMKQLSYILNGPVGKEAKLADKTPSKVFTDIFEKTDPQLQTQAQQVLPAPLYKQAAQQYLSDVVSQAGNSTPLKNMNNTNNLDKMQVIGNVLKNKTSKEVLPSAEQNIVDQAIKDIQQNMTGQVKTPFATSSRMDNSNPVATIGAAASGGNPVGFLAKTGDLLLGGPIKNRLNYNEMLGAGSPSSQIVASAGNNLAKLGQRINTVKALNAPTTSSQQPIPTPTPQIPNANAPGNIPGNVIPISANQSNQPSALDAVMQKYGLNNNAAAQPQSAIDAVLQKYGINDNSQNVKTSQQASLASRPYSQDELDFIHQKLKNNDVDSLVNFDKSFKDYQQGYEPLLKTLRKRESGDNYQNMKNPYGYVGAYQFGASALETVGLVKPGVGKMGNAALRNPNNWNVPGGLTTFLNTPSLQDSAAKMLLDSNKNTLTKAGVINDNTPIATRNGYLAAAHLKGAQGAINLFHGINSADAFGTTAQDYFKMGAAI